ncbi:MAG TPA: hypothetical protein VJ576_18785 [Rhodocyclaceae bacterium]|nr:hypothetical protein [Rhodocyclaceae bacterium]
MDPGRLVAVILQAVVDKVLEHLAKLGAVTRDGGQVVPGDVAASFPDGHVQVLYHVGEDLVEIDGLERLAAGLQPGVGEDIADELVHALGRAHHLVEPGIGLGVEAAAVLPLQQLGEAGDGAQGGLEVVGRDEGELLQLHVAVGQSLVGFDQLGGALSYAAFQPLLALVQPLLVLLARGDIHGDAPYSDGPVRLLVVEVTPDAFEPMERAVGPQEALLEPVLLALLQGLVQQFPDALPVVGMNCSQHPLEAQRFAGGDAEELAAAVRQLDMLVAGIPVPDADIGAAQGEFQILLAALQRLLGGDAFGNIEGNSPHRRHGTARIVEKEPADALQPADTPVRPEDSKLHVVFLSVFHGTPRRCLDLFPIIWVNCGQDSLVVDGRPDRDPEEPVLALGPFHLLGLDVYVPYAYAGPLHREFQVFLAASQGFLRIRPIGDISHESRHARHPAHIHFGDRRFEGEFFAIRPQSNKALRGLEGLGASIGFGKRPDLGGMAGPITFRHQGFQAGA